MLLFIDDVRHIRIVRKSETGTGREPLGRIRKLDGEPSEGLVDKLDAHERSEVHAALELMKAGEHARLQAGIAELPAFMREIVEFYRTEAHDVEKLWIRGAIQEANRLIRAHDNAVAFVPAE